MAIKIYQLQKAAMLAGALLWGVGVEEARADVRFFLTGNRLYEFCTIPSFDACYGYIEAIADVLIVNNAIGRSNIGIGGWTACIPANVTNDQIKDVVVQSLQKNPQERHYSASSLAARAISQAFPCPK